MRMLGGLGERKREIDRGARGRSTRRHARHKMTSASERARGPCCSQLNDAVRQPSLSRCPELNSRSLRRPPVVEPMTPPPSPSIIRRALLLPPPAPLPSCLSHPTDTSLLLTPPVCRLCTAIDATPESVASARACVRNGGRSVWRAPQKRHRPLLPPTRQPPLLPGRKRLTCPCKAQNAKTRRRRAARARRVVPAVARPYRHLGSLAHRSSSRAGHRPLPSSAWISSWISFALPYSRLPEKGTKLVTWGAAMIKMEAMWIKPRLRAIQPCLLRRAAPYRSLAPAGAPKAAGAAAIEI